MARQRDNYNLANYPPEIILELLVHELEEPLASINGCAKILENPSLAPAEQAVQAVVPILHGNVERLAALVANIHHYLEVHQKPN